MLPSGAQLPDNLSLRPARDEDGGFLESLYRSTRDDLRMTDLEADAVEHLIGMQYQAQTQGYGEQFPDAWHFVIERLGDRIGRVVLDFGPNEVRVVDIAFVPQARGRGFGTHILKALQMAATQVRAPLTLSVNPLNLSAKRLYLQLGFRVQETAPTVELLVWYPGEAGNTQ
jgi:ribosomal protein S18 acetylase RimI-like enzyme